MAHPSLASAVVLPEAPSPLASPSSSQPPHTTKRALPDDTNDPSSPKRQRTSQSPSAAKDGASTQARNGASSPTPIHLDRLRKASTSNPTPARPAVDDRDKKRNQRLFGALLGGLGGSARGPASARGSRDSAAAKRRAEQDERRKEEARKREAELGQRQQERLEKLMRERRAAQWDVDERDLRVRHRNLRAMACFLSTKAEPKLYYDPWKLRPEDEDVIKRQKEDVEILIDQELEDFDEKKRNRRTEDGHHEDVGLVDGREKKPDTLLETPAVGNTDTVEDITNLPQNQTEGVPLPERATVEEKREEEAEDQAPAPLSAEATAQNEEHEKRESDGALETNNEVIDETGDVVVEGEEDTVIY